MSYAIRKDGLGWRACSGPEDVGRDEIYSEVEPVMDYPTSVPKFVPALNALLALDASGFSSAYQEWAESSDRTFSEKAFITKALTWERYSPVTLMAMDALGITSDEADNLFILASGILDG